jgi:hypothetical protein
MRIKVIYFTEFGSSLIIMKIDELASWIKRYNFKIISIEKQNNIEENISHLKWIYNRMINIHNEDKNYDYMIKFQKILKQLKKK